MIVAVGLVPLNALAFVDPQHGAFATKSGSCSLSYTQKHKITNLSVRSGRTPNLLQSSATHRSNSCRNWRSLQRCEFGSSIFGSGVLESFKDERYSNRRSRKALDMRCDRSHDHHHHHHSHDEEEFCEPKKDKCYKKEECTKSFKKAGPPKECSESSTEGSESDDADQKNLAALVRSQRKSQKPLLTGCMMPDRSGDYTMYVSKELMGVFRYVEKVKRARTRDLAETLRNVSKACFLFSCVRGVLAPLVEVYKTSPPNWKNLLYMVGTFDSFAFAYLAWRASEPLFQLSMLATENDCDMMGSIKKEEEHMLALAIELVKLFRRLRNVTLFIALTQLVQVIIQLRDPAFARNIANIFGSWFDCPWWG